MRTYVGGSVFFDNVVLGPIGSMKARILVSKESNRQAAVALQRRYTRAAVKGRGPSKTESESSAVDRSCHWNQQSKDTPAYRLLSMKCEPGRRTKPVRNSSWKLRSTHKDFAGDSTSAHRSRGSNHVDSRAQEKRNAAIWTPALWTVA
jgi:hypothetical protein